MTVTTLLAACVFVISEPSLAFIKYTLFKLVVVLNLPRVNVSFCDAVTSPNSTISYMPSRYFFGV